MKFGMFFVGEYVGVTLISALIATLFFGGWLGPVLPPASSGSCSRRFVFIALFILVRASLPAAALRPAHELRLEGAAAAGLLNLVVTGASRAGRRDEGR